MLNHKRKSSGEKQEDDGIMYSYVGTDFVLEKCIPGGHEIKILVREHKGGKLTIETPAHDNEFIFVMSDTEIVKAIGQLLIKAATMIPSKDKLCKTP